MNVVSVVVAVCVFALALMWVVIGIAGLRGVLRRNRFFGVRTPQTLSSDEAFRLANRVAAPGTIGAGVILVAGGLLTVGVGGPWSFLYSVAALLAALVVVGAVSGYGVRAARWAATDDDGGCSCCSSDAAGAHAPDLTAASTDGPADDANAADCGESSCASCTLRGACIGEGGNPASRI